MDITPTKRVGTKKNHIDKSKLNTRLLLNSFDNNRLLKPKVKGTNNKLGNLILTALLHLASDTDTSENPFLNNLTPSNSESSKSVNPLAQNKKTAGALCGTSAKDFVGVVKPVNAGTNLNAALNHPLPKLRPQTGPLRSATVPVPPCRTLAGEGPVGLWQPAKVPYGSGKGIKHASEGLVKTLNILPAGQGLRPNSRHGGAGLMSTSVFRELLRPEHKIKGATHSMTSKLPLSSLYPSHNLDGVLHNDCSPQKQGGELIRPTSLFITQPMHSIRLVDKLKLSILTASLKKKLTRPMHSMNSSSFMKPPKLYTSYSKIEEIKLVTIEIASADKIRQWAERTLPNGKVVGEVTNANTLHHKTFKPQKGGLFCERIFGPLKDFECACGKQMRPLNEEKKELPTVPIELIGGKTPDSKDLLFSSTSSLGVKPEEVNSYKKVFSYLENPLKQQRVDPNWNKSISPHAMLPEVGVGKAANRKESGTPSLYVRKLGPIPIRRLVRSDLGANVQEQKKFCAICDVQYTRSVVRRYQLGYIQLVSPAAHVWYVKSNPSYIAIVLDMKKKHLEHLTYCVETSTLENSINQVSGETNLHTGAFAKPSSGVIESEGTLNDSKKNAAFNLFSSWKNLMKAHQTFLPLRSQLGNQPLPTVSPLPYPLLPLRSQVGRALAYATAGKHTYPRGVYPPGGEVRVEGGEVAQHTGGRGNAMLTYPDTEGMPLAWSPYPSGVVPSVVSRPRGVGLEIGLPDASHKKHNPITPLEVGVSQASTPPLTKVGPHAFGIRGSRKGELSFLESFIAPTFNTAKQTVLKKKRLMFLQSVNALLCQISKKGTENGLYSRLSATSQRSSLGAAKLSPWKKGSAGRKAREVWNRFSQSKKNVAPLLFPLLHIPQRVVGHPGSRGHVNESRVLKKHANTNLLIKTMPYTTLNHNGHKPNVYSKLTMYRGIKIFLASYGIIKELEGLGLRHAKSARVNKVNLIAPCSFTVCKHAVGAKPIYSCSKQTSFYISSKINANLSSAAKTINNKKWRGKINVMAYQKYCKKAIKKAYQLAAVRVKRILNKVFFMAFKKTEAEKQPYLTLQSYKRTVNLTPRSFWGTGTIKEGKPTVYTRWLGDFLPLCSQTGSHKLNKQFPPVTNLKASTLVSSAANNSRRNHYWSIAPRVKQAFLASAIVPVCRMHAGGGRTSLKLLFFPGGGSLLSSFAFTGRRLSIETGITSDWVQDLHATVPDPDAMLPYPLPGRALSDGFPVTYKNKLASLNKIQLYSAKSNPQLFKKIDLMVKKKLHITTFGMAGCPKPSSKLITTLVVDTFVKTLLLNKGFYSCATNLGNPLPPAGPVCVLPLPPLPEVAGGEVGAGVEGGEVAQHTTYGRGGSPEVANFIIANACLPTIAYTTFPPFGRNFGMQVTPDLFDMGKILQQLNTKICKPYKMFYKAYGSFLKNMATTPTWLRKSKREHRFSKASPNHRTVHCLYYVNYRKYCKPNANPFIEKKNGISLYKKHAHTDLFIKTYTTLCSSQKGTINPLTPKRLNQLRFIERATNTLTETKTIACIKRSGLGVRTGKRGLVLSSRNQYFVKQAQIDQKTVFGFRKKANLSLPSLPYPLLPLRSQVGRALAKVMHSIPGGEVGLKGVALPLIESGKKGRGIKRVKTNNTNPLSFVSPLTLLINPSVGKKLRSNGCLPTVTASTQPVTKHCLRQNGSHMLRTGPGLGVEACLLPLPPTVGRGIPLPTVGGTVGTNNNYYKNKNSRDVKKGNLSKPRHVFTAPRLSYSSYSSINPKGVLMIRFPVNNFDLITTSKIVNNIYVFSHRELWPDAKEWQILSLFLGGSSSSSAASLLSQRGNSFSLFEDISIPSYNYRLSSKACSLNSLTLTVKNPGFFKVKPLTPKKVHEANQPPDPYATFASLPEPSHAMLPLPPYAMHRKHTGGTVAKHIGSTVASDQANQEKKNDSLILSKNAEKEGVMISGAGLVQKLLKEFNIFELKKMDQQNRILLYQLNKKIAKLKKKVYNKKIKKLLKEWFEKRDFLRRRTKLFRKLYRKDCEASSMILSLLPVLPPDLRPIIKIADQIAASDLNRLYQRVIYRNDRLKKFLKDITTSESYEMKYAQRLLQEAVDNLIQNGKSGVEPEVDSRGRLLKSLSDVLKGKQGRFRQYLLGKRVDYSGRSVIVVGPKLKLHQCGIPKDMAIELYLPFLLKRILNEKLAKTVVGAKIFIKTNKSVTWGLLREIMQVGPVLLNRAPTLHRLGFQAFQPKLIEGKAILLHPLVCAAFNADFDGDQMAVHVPITVEARAEAWKLMLARNNVLSAATGEPIAIPSQDMVLGCYFLTTYSNNTSIKHLTGSSHYFSNLNDVLKAYNQQLINVHAVIWVKWDGRVEGPQVTGNSLVQPLALPKKELIGAKQETQTKLGWEDSTLEIRLIPNGKRQEINSEYLKTFDCFGFPINQYIRTTPGRILFNTIIKDAQMLRIPSSQSNE